MELCVNAKPCIQMRNRILFLKVIFLEFQHQHLNAFDGVFLTSDAFGIFDLTTCQRYQWFMFHLCPAGDDDYYDGEEDAAELTEEGQAQLERLDGLLQTGNDDGDNFDDEPQIGNRATNNGTRGMRHIFP